jgi:uncharacterized protein (DUF2126 family)
MSEREHAAEFDDPAMEALAAHDRAVAATGRCIWLGAEPTYTAPDSEAFEWLYHALGPEKSARAAAMLTRLARATEGAMVLRSVGRQYGGEPTPRWSLGLYGRRDAGPLWSGPPDPLLTDDPGHCPPPDELARGLASELRSAGFTAAALGVDAPMPARVVFRSDAHEPPSDPADEPELARESVHSQRVEGAEIRDGLAEGGTFLVACGVDEGVMRVELPAISNVRMFWELLGALSRAALASGLRALVIAGYPPPVDEEVAWTTITPDPAVIEVNMAPVENAVDLLARLRELESTARTVGLAPFRLHYNGNESDSGGGGQVTLGGPRPDSSPFVLAARLLPSLVRYFNRHPALSYLHAPDCVGPDSQAPRADEGVRESFAELGLALELLHREAHPSPETLWSALAPFLADTSGNPHRTEINIEKFWNPYLGARGRQGLVEFRALRMGPTAEATAALAALLRAVVAMLADHPDEEPLVDWGDVLHQRFSLPFYLRADLRAVLSDLEKCGLPLADPLVGLLLDDSHRLLAERVIVDCRVEIRRAVEFWPLVGDAATQQGGSRQVDASTARIEIRLAPNAPGTDIADWMLSAGNWALPLRDDRGEAGPVRLVGLRYRSFAPTRGLHPTLEVRSPLPLVLAHPRHGAWRITLHEWRPDGGPYPGLPTSFDEARARRDARCVVEDLGAAPQSTPPMAEALGDYVVDLRWQ